MNNTNGFENPFQTLDLNIFEHLSSYLLPRDIKRLSTSCTFFCDPQKGVLRVVLQTNTPSLLLFIKNYHLLSSFQRESVRDAVVHGNMFSKVCNIEGESEASSLQRCAQAILTESDIFSRAQLFAKIQIAIVANDKDAIEKLLIYEDMLDLRSIVQLLQIAKKIKAQDATDALLATCAKSKGMPLRSFATQLLQQAIKKDIEIDVFLENGADILSIDEHGNGFLHLACRNNNFHAVSMLIAYGVQVNSVNNKCETPLHFACLYADEFVVEVLIQNGANCKASDFQNKTPLHRSASIGSYETAHCLLNNGASLDCKDLKDNTPLHLACSTGSFEISQLFCERGAKTDCRNSDNCTPFHLAVISGNMKLVQFLLDWDQSIDAVNYKNQTALHLASKHGCEEIVKILLRHGAKLEDVDCDGNTPLHIACQNNREGVASILLQSGANKNSINNQKRTSLHLACFYGHNLVIKILIKVGAEKDTGDADGNTPLHLACLGRHHRIVSYLLENGAFKDARNITQDTPLHLACRKGHMPTVKVLVKQRAEVNFVTKDKVSALHIACYKGFDDVALYLLKKGARVDLVDTTSNTAFHMACMMNRNAVVAQILENGVPIDRRAQFFLERNANAHAITPLGYSSLHHALDTFDFEKALEILDREEVDLLQTDSSTRSCLTIIEELCKTLNITCSEDNSDKHVYARKQLVSLLDVKIDPIILCDKKISLPCFSHALCMYRGFEIIKPGKENLGQVAKINSIIGRKMHMLQNVSQITSCIENAGELSTRTSLYEMHLLRQIDSHDIQGVIVFHKESPTTLKIDALGVDPTCKRQKLGTILLLFAMKVAHKNAMRSITLNTSREGVFLYNSFGFRAMGEYSKDQWSTLDEKKQFQALDYARSVSSDLKASLDDKTCQKKIQESLVKSFRATLETLTS